jgi:alkanesulfonate monooxygenase SsuD/methylene tetrahydromethanopterin reductase-like flavin-dependent oxidoreductase (luciferase family)
VGRGFGVTAAVPAAVIADVAEEAERLGYTSFWTNDMPHASGLAALAAAAEATSHIGLGVGVLPLDERSPTVITRDMEAYRLPRDRLIVGVGSGARHHALARARAGVAALREELGGRIVVGALGPKMCELAGETADGALFNWLTPEHAELAGRSVRDAAASAGRPEPALMAYVRCGLLPDAQARFADELARYAGVPQFEGHLARMGASPADTCVLRSDDAALQSGIARYEAVLDETIVRAITPDDSVDTVLKLLRACAP